MGQHQGRKEKYPQGREFGPEGESKRDLDFTDHGRQGHPNPHQHKIDPSKGKPGERGAAEPLDSGGPYAN